MVRLLGKPPVRIALPEKSKITLKNDIRLNSDVVTLQGRLINKTGRINTGAYIDKGKLRVNVP
jgi:hypothetical protein